MKTKVLFLTAIFFMCSTWCDQLLAADRVVVIPLNSVKKLNNVITVSARGGDFTDPVAAMDSITDAGENNPYLVLIGPGKYTLTKTLVMKPYVSIVGSGQQTTVLLAEIATTYVGGHALATVNGANYASIANLTIWNHLTATNGTSIAIHNDNSSPTIENVTLKASGGNYCSALDNTDSAPTISHVYAWAYCEGLGPRTISNGNSSPSMTDVTVFASASGGVGLGEAIYNQESSPTMSNVRLYASGAQYNRGMTNTNHSNPVLTNVTAKAYTGNNCSGISNYHSSPTMTNVLAEVSGCTQGSAVYFEDFVHPIIRGCTFISKTAGVNALQIDKATSPNLIKIFNSSLIGNIQLGSNGNPICLNSNDGARELNTSCQPQ